MLARVMDYLFVRLGETLSILVAGRKLLTPLPEALLENKSNVEITTEATEEWGILFLDFLEYGRLPDEHSKKVEIRQQQPKF